MINAIYEDNDIVVVDKPSGITVNRSETTINEKTVADLILENFHFLENSPKDSDFYIRSGIVHRIDKETSGILLVAKTEENFLNLQLQFKERKVDKTYIALAHGLVNPLQGDIKVPVGRLPWNRKRFGVLAGGKEALTHYKVSEFVGDKFSLMELNPKTGRTHQIRVHLKYINHPIFADDIYAGRKTARQDRKILNRLFLHASKISFFHPKTGERVKFESKLPNELNTAIERLKKIDNKAKN